MIHKRDLEDACTVNLGHIYETLKMKYVFGHPSFIVTLFPDVTVWTADVVVCLQNHSSLSIVNIWEKY